MKNKKETAQEVPVQEQPNNSIFILKLNVLGKEYFLTDLEGTLSKDIKDSLMLLNYNKASRVGGDIKTLFEEKFGINVGCIILTTTIQMLFQRIRI